MLKIKLLIIVILLSIQGMFAQKGPISGKVIDQDGYPVVGASVYVEGTSKGVITNFDGDYIISKVIPPEKLTFSYTGMIPQVIAVEDKKTINVTLEKSLESLSEIVVIGYGKTSRALVSGAISTVKSEQITSTPVVSLDQALQGRAAGANIVNSGSPGSPPRVLIRGLGTFGNSDPLYVIDGVVSQGLNEINPNDIETIDILKDASTAAIYGSRASNGVVIVTTKRGKSGKARVTIDNFVSVQTLPQKLDLLNNEQFRTYTDETFGLPNRYTTDPESTLIRTDWQDEVFKDAIMYNTNVNVSGGNETATYSISAGNLEQDGIIINTGFRRTSLRANSEFKIGKRLKIGETLSVADSKRSNEEENGDRTLVEHLIKSLPYIPVFDANNLGGFGGPDTTLDNGSDAENPVRLQTNGSNTTDNTKILGSIYSSLEIIDGLEYKFQYGFDRSTNELNIHTPAFDEGINKLEAAALKQQTSIFSSDTYTNSLNYNKTLFDNHNFDLLLVAERFNTKLRINNAIASNPFSNDIPVIDGNEDATVNNRLERYQLESYVGRINYNFAKKYLLSASLRRDESSRFGPNNSEAYFPAFSAGWVISKEAFLENIDAISNLKIRGSWGKTGNDRASDYAYQSGLLPGYNYANFPTTTNVGISNFGVANPDLKWEETTMTNLGLDLGLFNNAFNLSFEYFDRDAEDIIVRIPNVASFGLGEEFTFRNGGNMNVKGVELTLGYTHDKGTDFSWGINLNLGTTKNEVTKLNDKLEFIEFNAFEGENISRIEEGESPFFFYGLETNGLFQEGDDTSAQPNATAGDIRFVDQKDENGNSDGIIDENDNVKIGDPFPDFTYGINLSANYKQFDATAFFNGMSGNDIYNTNIYDLEGMTRLFNAGTAVLNRWTPTNTNTSIPRFTADHSDNVNRSDRFVEDGSFFRLRNLTFGYSLSNTNLKNILNGTFSKVRVYLSGQNLFTITDYSGYDPEIGGSTLSGNENTPTAGIGIDRGSYPQPRTYTLGVQLAF